MIHSSSQNSGIAPANDSVDESLDQISLRIRTPISQEARRRAKKSGVSLNKYIEAVLADSLGLLPAPGTAAHPNVGATARRVVTQGEPLDPKAWRLRQYVGWLPLVAVIRNLDGTTALANEELRRLVDREDVIGLRPSAYWGASAASWVEVHDQIVRESNKSILCLERIPEKNVVSNRLGVRFPIRDKSGQVKMTAAIGLDLGELRKTGILRPRESGRRPWRMRSCLTNYGQNVADSLLSDFLYSVPAIAVAKDPDGHLLCVNHWYYRITGKTPEVIGRLPSENWAEETADVITAHDQLVRETSRPFISVEKVEMKRGSEERLTLRFPILGPTGDLEMIGALGFHYELFKKAIEELTKPNGYKKVYPFEPDGTELLQPIEAVPSYDRQDNLSEWMIESGKSE